MAWNLNEAWKVAILIKYKVTEHPFKRKRLNGSLKELRQHLVSAANFKCQEQGREMALAIQACEEGFTFPDLLHVFPTGDGKILL